MRASRGSSRTFPRARWPRVSRKGVPRLGRLGRLAGLGGTAKGSLLAYSPRMPPFACRLPALLRVSSPLVVDIFVGRGVSQEDAQVIIDRMSKYPEFFVNLMMTEELGLQMPDEQERVLLRAVVMFGAFASFGMLPIFGYVAASFFVQEVGDSQSQAHMMVAACVITSITLVALGAFKAHFAHRRYLRAAFETLLLGSACASVSYYVGQAVSSVDW